MSAPNLKEVEWAIHELKNKESSEANYELLASLLICRDELMGRSTVQTYVPQIASYSQAAGPVAVSMQEPLGRYGDSDFLRAVEGKDPAEAWRVIDDHMRTLQAINRRSYNTVLERIRNL